MEMASPLHQRLTPPPEKPVNMPQNLCVLNLANTGTEESSARAREITNINIKQ